MSSYYMDYQVARVHLKELRREAEEVRRFKQAKPSRPHSSRLHNLLAKITRQA